MDFRDVKDFLFEFIKFLLSLIQVVTWRYYNVGQLRQNTYERSAQVCKILLRHKRRKDLAISSIENCVFIHQEFCHPRIILHDNVSRYRITKREAVFVDCGNLDVFDSTHDAFVYNAQFRHATHLIIIPLESFHQVSKGISLPGIPFISLANHGRCGSTLLTKIFEAVPNSLSISEPVVYTDLAELSRRGRLARSDLVNLCYSISLCILKHASARKSDIVFLKLQNTVVYVADIMLEAVPIIRQVFMYRDPSPTIRSWEKLYIANKWPAPTVKNLKIWAGIGHNDLLKRYPVYPFHYISGLELISKFSLIWITGVAAFNELIRQGYEVRSLKYEDFLTAPESTLKTLFHYAGIPCRKLPNVKEVMEKDSQKGTKFTTRHLDQRFLRKGSCKVTEQLRAQIDSLCYDFSVPLFWEPYHLLNKL